MQVYTPPGSCWGAIMAGGGAPRACIGANPTGWQCVATDSSLNLKYPGTAENPATQGQIFSVS